MHILVTKTLYESAKSSLRSCCRAEPCFYDIIVYRCLGSEMESGSLSSKYYLVELQVNQSRKKSQGKTAQNIYAHSSLMRKPTSDHHSLLITSEANSGTPDSPTPSSSPQTQRKDSGKVCVASFPSIISHDVIMDEGLLTKNYLIVSFALRHYQQPT